MARINVELDGVENETDLFQYLSQSRVNKDTLRTIIIPHLMSMGFESVDDLQDLELKYLDNDGEAVSIITIMHSLYISEIKELDKNRIMKLVSPKSLNLFTSQATRISQLDTDDTIYLRYIFCGKELFSVDVEELAIENMKYATPLKDIVSDISAKANLATNEVIELYSHEGYPLHNNELSNTGIM